MASRGRRHGRRRLGGRAIQYLTAQGDRQSLSTPGLMQSPTEQASIRDAATRAYRTLGGE